MRLRELSVRVISGDLARPVGNPDAPGRHRAGLVLTLTDAEGNVGLGEASPLPGFSPDSLESCRADLERLTPLAVEGCLQAPAATWLDRLGRARALLSPGSPAAVFALETALVDLVCVRDQCSPFDVFQRPPQQRVELNAVLVGTSPNALAEARSLAQRGYATLKLKLGSRWEQALDTLTQLAEKGEFRLRVDANRGLGVADLERALPRLCGLGLEFVEEPCAPALWPSLPTERPRLALDETLVESGGAGLPDLIAASGARVVVLKPMALGGFSECLRLADAARSLGCEVVVTHLFDGPLALRAASVLALMVQSPGLAAGLAPHAGLAAWPAPLGDTEVGPRLEPGLFQAGISPTRYSEALRDPGD